MNKMIFTAILMISAQSMAEGLLSNFVLTKGSSSECPIRLEVTRANKQIKMRVANSMNMNDGGVFQNNLTFSNINTGWISTEVSAAGDFTQNTELRLSGSKTKLIVESKLVSQNAVERHTQIIFKVSDDQTALLSYKIIKLKKGVIAESYASFNCYYKIETEFK